MTKTNQIVLQILLITFMYSSKDSLTTCQDFEEELENRLKCSSGEPYNNFWSSTSSYSDDLAFEMFSPTDLKMKFVVRVIDERVNDYKNVRDVTAILLMNSKFGLAAFASFWINDNRFVFYEPLTSFRFFNQKFDGTKLEDNQKLYEFIVKLAYGIGDLHSHDYSHSNLNIDSIMMIDDSPKITRFDWARASPRPLPFYGSLAYVPPELIQKCLPDLPVNNRKEWLTEKLKSSPDYVNQKIKATPSKDQKIDMYALGVIIYTITQKKLPYDETAVLETVLQKLEGELTFVRPIHPRIKNIIHGLMATDPSKRFKIVDLVRYLQQRASLDDVKSLVQINLSRPIPSRAKDPLYDQFRSLFGFANEVFKATKLKAQNTFFSLEYSSTENQRLWDFLRPLARELGNRNRQLESVEMNNDASEKLSI